MIYNQKIGKLGENIAVRYLRKHGYKILDRNIHFRCGEIDIVAEKNKTLYFVEVKARTNYKFGDLEDSVSERKIHKIQDAIFAYLTLNSVEGPYFVAVICIYLNMVKKSCKISYFEL